VEAPKGVLMLRRSNARRPRPGIGWVLLALLALVLFYLLQSGAGALLLDRAGSGLPDDQAVRPLQAFFTTPTLVYPDRPDRRGRAPLLEAALADLDRARTSIDLATFDFDIAAVTDALIRAQKRGVAVRVIIDSENLDTPEVAAQAGRLQAAGILVRFDRREPFMHDKFLVVDGAVVWTGSWNGTANDTFRNNNNMLRFASTTIAAAYTYEFDQMVHGRLGGSKHSTPRPERIPVGTATVEVYFAPTDGVAEHILERLQAARASIRFLAFSYTSDAIAAQMVARAQDGLVVQGVFEAQNADGSGSVFQALSGGGVDVLEDGNCYLMHHKVIVIDDRTVITGSYNFTKSAERDNDENLVIVDDPTLARAYLDEFERVYTQAQSPTRCR
jgi:phosphatidylserine/phosphatidylglycerophosphate/cardiolipin synthase-like enzyme